ncbi:MAG TPA: phosphoribosylglycinamide formyltransferase [Bacteroidia bacterium]|jgi:phosphoribosylglycinamide formyltransferase-1
MNQKNIAIFASGEGTNAQNIIDHFKNSSAVKVALIVSNRPNARVLERAKREDIPTLVIDRNSFYNSDQVIEQLKSFHIDFIVLAGFLWMVPLNLIKAFPSKVINIHPALLPKFGGKGMYGINVHKAVIEAKEKESGISIHFVNEHYDEGEIVAQHTCIVSENDSPESLSEKIHQLEKAHFAKAIQQLLQRQ